MSAKSVHTAFRQSANHRLDLRRFRVLGLLMAAITLPVAAAQIDIVGPAGSGAFATSVTVLPNGYIVVTDPNGPVSNVGAVYLYTPAGVLISTITGSSVNDQVGSGGITVLGNGNFVINSPLWNDGLTADVGAVTWANGTSGIAGVVSAANSLIGTTFNDRVGGFIGVTALSNGNYVVRSPGWDNGGIVDAGALTWGNGNTGISGVVSVANSLIGSTLSDAVGGGVVTVLNNGNYVLANQFWDDGVIADVGAVTWGNGSSGVTGVVSSANSLIGSTASDRVGIDVIALSNGNYVVASSLWDNGGTADVGAVTWANGSTGMVGPVSVANSLIGASANDFVGSPNGHSSVAVLNNGNYVVSSPFWSNGISDVGAVTWANGSTGLIGVVSPTNSLIGTSADDQVGGDGVTALSNGNYVVGSRHWDNGLTADVGAATWGNGSSGLVGVVSPANSLIGTSANDLVGFGGGSSNNIAALSNGNYAVGSSFWNNGATTGVGAVTWANGSTGRVGVVSPANSLIGSTLNDQVGNVIALSNGNYVVRSPVWNNGGTVDVGAVTWANGSSGLVGVVSPANSLIGTTTGDCVGGCSNGGVTALNNGNYVVSSPNWNNGTTFVGAVTWVNGSTGISALVAPANSMIGTITQDFVGGGTGGDVTALSSGNFVIKSPVWNNVGILDAGAVSMARGTAPVIGTILPVNSVRGTVTSGGANMVFSYDAALDRLAVGRPASNILSLFTLPSDVLFANGFE